MTLTNKATNPKWEEVILVSPRQELFASEKLVFQGVEQDKEKIDLIMKNLSENLISVRRGSLDDTTLKENNAEINKSLKQPIPYVLIKRDKEIFVYERLSQGGEIRLHNKLSLGVGGHMNPEVGTFNEQLMINLNRELEEELEIVSDVRDLSFIGLINDDNNEVGQVHLGILAVLNLSKNATVSVQEIEQLRGFWIDLKNLKNKEIYDRLESWSQIAVDII